MDLARLLFGEADELIVEVDGFERLDEERMAAGAGPVNDAIELAALSGDDRDHEALVADGDELFLEHAFLAVRAQEALERVLNRLLLPLDVAAQAVERDAGVVGDRAVGEDLAVELLEQRAEIADGRGAGAEQREALGGGGEDGLGIGGAVEQGEEVEDLFGIETGAFDVQFVDGGLGVGQAAEVDADGGAARGRLRTGGEAQVLDGFAGLGEVVRRGGRGRRAAAPFPVRGGRAGSTRSGRQAGGAVRIRELQRRFSSETLSYFRRSKEGAGGRTSRPAIMPAMMRESLMHQNPEPGFRWRGREIARIEGLSDAVFAFSVTLLVVSLEVPKTFNELAALMRGFVPFAISFFLLLQIWHEQYRFFRRYNLQDAVSTVLNCILLFVVLFYVYPLKFLWTFLMSAWLGHGAIPRVSLPNGASEAMLEPHQLSQLMAIFSGGYLAVSCIFLLLFAHALRRHNQLELDTREIHLTKVSIGAAAIQGFTATASLIIALTRRGTDWRVGRGRSTPSLLAPGFTIYYTIMGAKRPAFGR